MLPDIKIIKMNPVLKFLKSMTRFLDLQQSIRCYSMYPKYYQDPLIEKKEIEDLIKNSHPVELQAIRFKAAENDVSCSVFFDPDVQLLTRYLMRKGNKSLARSLVEKTFENIKRIQLKKYYSLKGENKEELQLNPLNIFHEAVKNCSPVLTVKIIVRSGTKYQVPSGLTPKKSKFLAMHYLIHAAKDKPRNERFALHLAYELINASQCTGRAFQKKIDLIKLCEANRAYAHYRWA